MSMPLKEMIVLTINQTRATLQIRVQDGAIQLGTFEGGTPVVATLTADQVPELVRALNDAVKELARR